MCPDSPLLKFWAHEKKCPLAFASGAAAICGTAAEPDRFLRLRTGEHASHGVVNSVTDGGTDHHTSRCCGHLGHQIELCLGRLSVEQRHSVGRAGPWAGMVVGPLGVGKEPQRPDVSDLPVQKCAQPAAESGLNLLVRYYQISYRTQKSTRIEKFVLMAGETRFTDICKDEQKHYISIKSTDNSMILDPVFIANQHDKDWSTRGLFTEDISYVSALEDITSSGSLQLSDAPKDLAQNAAVSPSTASPQKRTPDASKTTIFSTGTTRSRRSATTWAFRRCLASCGGKPASRPYTGPLPLEYAIVQLSDSKLAGAALMSNMSGWNTTLEFCSGYKIEDFAAFAVLKSPKKSLNTVHQEYSHELFSESAKALHHRSAIAV
ncbi:cyclin B3 [Culex quinquefasciatus]|uniref:Cyclin B3 n=1 Tax=Culex quinquefasciatus TaxID=7176 RepID=B0WLC0_CULQU|nr:cyclin B3 [Culex quinquefasciatus]|eukprot:XP_001849504.1 cyclin B3 [Culex quinquefasciatus]